MAFAFNKMNNHKKQTLNKKCASHPSISCDVLLLDPNVEKHKICSKCLIEKKLFEKVISIEELLSYDESLNVALYPLIEDNDL